MTSWVRTQREAASMSQVEFARAIGRSLDSVRRYEHGIEPPPEVATKIREIAAKCGAATPEPAKSFTDAELLDALEAYIKDERALLIWDGTGPFPGVDICGLSLMRGERSIRRALSVIARSRRDVPALKVVEKE